MPRYSAIALLLLLGCRPVDEPLPPDLARVLTPTPGPTATPGAAATAQPVEARPVETSPAPAPEPEPVEPAGPVAKLDKQDIRDVVLAHRADIGACYGTGQARHPELAGRVTIEFTIGSTGAVTRAIVLASTLPERSRQVAECIATMAGRWVFPPPIGGGNVTVAYPFVLRAAQLSPSVLAPGGQRVGQWFRVTGRDPNTILVEVRDAANRRAVAGIAVSLVLRTRGAADEHRKLATDAQGLAAFHGLPAAGHAVAAIETEAGAQSSSLPLDGASTMATVLLHDPPR